MPPAIFPITCRTASRSPIQVFSPAMFILKPVGNLLTLDWVVCNAAKAGSSSIAVMPMASRENRAIRHRSPKKRLKPCQRQIS